MRILTLALVARAGINASGDFFYGHGSVINPSNSLTINHSDSDFRDPHIIMQYLNC